MQMLEAMRETISMMDARLKDATPTRIWFIETELSEDLQPSHLRQMLRVMESGINPQDTEAGFSDGKMGRWLGWAQAAVVSMGLSTLDEMKAINKRWAST